MTTDATGNVSFTTTVPASSTPGQFISATATDPAGNTSEFCLDVMTQGQINLVVSGTAAPNPVLAGGQLTYALSIANQGNIAAQQVRLSDQLPSGVTLVSVTLSQGQVYSVSPSGQIARQLWARSRPGGR